MIRKIHGWGGCPSIHAEIISCTSRQKTASSIHGKSEIIARGNGRSYGDASISRSVFSTLSLSNVIEFDPARGVLEAEAGILLKNILELIIPFGYFLPVTPGTQLITLGGAIAADVHGKNHLTAGSFSNHLLSFQILDHSKKIVTCSRSENSNLFWETCGGMGLTGIIITALIKLKPIESTYLRSNIQKVTGINSLLTKFKNQQGEYSVAWLDSFQKVDSIPAVFTTADHIPFFDLPKNLQKKPLTFKSKQQITIPFHAPSFALNYKIGRLFNTFYLKRKIEADRLQTAKLASFFFPLDTIKNWPLLYGKKGLLQYQFVIPFSGAEECITEVLKRIHQAAIYPFLSVIKMFGEVDDRSVMSFPMPGFTLAMDFKWSPDVLNIFNDLDQIVLEYGGKIYLAKDARMNANTFKRMYKRWVTHHDYYKSLLSYRLEI
ncbi:MAG: FAD-binding oxidoreductase [Saprospiraceae bacterium]|nr:FAD-binding oxidoreductase [Saprospiraceae bacterium]